MAWTRLTKTVRLEYMEYECERNIAGKLRVFAIYIDDRSEATRESQGVRIRLYSQSKLVHNVKH